MSVRESAQITIGLVSPECRCRFLLGGPANAPERHILDFQEETVNLADATIDVEARIKRPDGSSFAVDRARWLVKVKSITEAWLIFWPKADEFTKFGPYEVSLTAHVNEISHPMPSFTIQGVEKHVQPNR